jgi:DNA polymerase-4
MALEPKLRDRPVFVGGGRTGDGIVIAANYPAKRRGITTGMACFEARRICPDGVLCPPQYNEYRRLSLEMFRRLRQYTPLLVPFSIDEGCLDFDQMPRVFHARNAEDLAKRIKREIRKEVGIPLTMGIACSPRVAKLAAELNKPDGFKEVPPDGEAEFLKNVPIDELTGVGYRRMAALHALRMRSFGDIARADRRILLKRFGILGMELWMIANGLFREPLVCERKPRTCISNFTTLPVDEPDYERALLFLETQVEKVITTFFRENLKAHEMSVFVRFNDFSHRSRAVRFTQPLYIPSAIQPFVEQMFHDLVCQEQLPVRQVGVSFWNFVPLNLERDLFGDPPEVRLRELHYALEKIEARFGRDAVMSARRLQMIESTPYLAREKAKCPFTPQREMQLKLDKIPEVVY